MIIGRFFATRIRFMIRVAEMKRIRTQTLKNRDGPCTCDLSLYFLCDNFSFLNFTSSASDLEEAAPLLLAIFSAAPSVDPAVPKEDLAAPSDV